MDIAKGKEFRRIYIRLVTAIAAKQKGHYMFKEYMIVSATEKINDIVNKGCLGTIVYIYSTDIYEVEFFDDNKNTISIETVSKKQIQCEN